MDAQGGTNMDAQGAIGQVRADFWTCMKCRRLCTGIEMMKALGIGGNGTACPCGSQHYYPANLPWWGWFLPRVWVFAYRRIRKEA